MVFENDPPALTRSDIGIVDGKGTDVAIESAGVIVVENNPMDMRKIVQRSQASHQKMIQNLWKAARVLEPYGILLTPAVGVLLISMSMAIVVINAQLLHRLELENATS